MERGYETVEETIYIPEGFLLLVDLEEGKIVLRKKEKEPIKGLKHQGWKLEFEGEVEEECDDNANTPKFNIGDWIVSDLEDVNEDYRLCKIIGIKDGCYTIQSANGCKGYNFFEIWESDFHLWSIKDAKPGDVLVTDFEEDNMIVMYHSMCTIDTINVCCCLDNKFTCANLGIFDAEDVKPATKEQRDLLFQKMREAGYMWDAEKKKIEPKNDKCIKSDDNAPTAYGKYVDECLFEASKHFHSTGEDAYSVADLFYAGVRCGINWTEKKGQKSEWSEEDEKRIKRVIYILSLDGRIGNEELKSILDWLKSLRPQTTWKPSDGQMKALKEACDEHWEPDGLDPLYTLYQDLKKLREE